MIEPQHEEAELHVLAACLAESDKVLPRLTTTRLRPEDFYKDTHQRLYKAILEARDRIAGQVDLVTLEDYLKHTGQLDAVGGKEYIALVSTWLTSTYNVAEYARVIKENAQRRALIRHTQEAAQQIAQGDYRAAAAHLTIQVDETVRDDDTRKTVYNGYELAQAYEEKLRNPPSEQDGIPTPFPDCLTPMQKGRLHVLGGYPGEGKTVLSIQFTLAALAAGKKVGFVSLEMSTADLIDRIVSCHGLNYQQVMDGRFEYPDDLRKAHEVIAEMASWGERLQIVDDPWIDPAGIRQYARAGGYDLLVIDHLHRLPWKERNDFEAHIKFLTNTAKELDQAVLLLSQLTRQGHLFPRPTMQSFRESGMVEAEAAAAWLVWRKRDDEGHRTEETDFIVDKNRFGREATIPLWFDNTRVRFHVDDSRMQG